MRKIVSSLLMSQAAAHPVDQVHRVWFEEQAEIGLDYNTMKSNCAARGAAIVDTVGFPAFFRNQADYDNFRSSISDDPLYLGYEQQNGDNNQWLNADGTEVTFTNWKTSGISQPNNAEHACVISAYADITQWHDVSCENNNSWGYACRFETTRTADQQSLTLIGDVPIAPANSNYVGTIDSAAYSSFEVDIFCASGSLPLNGYKSILHVTSGTNAGEIGSRVFTFLQNRLDQSIIISSPGEKTFARHACVTNTYSTYKIIVSPDEIDSSKKVVELFIDNVLVNELTIDKDHFLGDGTQLQVWAGKTWDAYGIASTYLIKNFIYTPVR